MTKGINHTGTDRIVCPWCGHEYSRFGLSEPGENVINMRCDICPNHFSISSVLNSYSIIRYNTRKILPALMHGVDFEYKPGG